MNGRKWQAAACVALAAWLLLAVILGSRGGDTVLEFGMFAGSNWGVANADSCVIIDKAIEKFEKPIRACASIITAAFPKRIIPNGWPGKF